MIRNVLALRVICSLILTANLVATDDTTTQDELDASTSDIIRFRGYSAEDHYVVTSSGHILNLVKATNPLIIKNVSRTLDKEPILFLHGVLTTSKCFVVNSVDATPKDYSDLDAGSMPAEALTELLKDDPTSNSLVFTALNFGHEVWLLNRRGSPDSLNHVGQDCQPFKNPISNIVGTLVGDSPFIGGRKKRQVNPETDAPLTGLLQTLFSTQLDLSHLSDNINPRFWNYSLDEQAKYDIPEVIDYVLEETGRPKLVLVGHSAGSALGFMSLTEYPSLARKVSKFLAWAPALDLGSTFTKNPLIGIGSLLLRYPIMSYIGPLPPQIFVPLFHNLESVLCQTELLQSSVCTGLVDLLFGYGGDQQKIKPGFTGAFPSTISSHESASLIQSVLKGKMQYYDYADSNRNLIAYGQPTAPFYDISKIISRSISVWVGGTDSLVPPEDVDKIIRRLTEALLSCVEVCPSNRRVRRGRYQVSLDLNEALCPFIVEHDSSITLIRYDNRGVVLLRTKPHIKHSSQDQSL